MKNWKAFAFLLLSSLALTACGNSKDAATIYVLAPPQKASRFTQDLAVIAKRHELDPNLGQSTDDKGFTYRVIEANGSWLHLWGTNIPLSGNESPGVCGHYAGSHPDPGQYIVTVDHGLVRIGFNHILALIASGRPHELSSEIGKELSADGYTVRTSPVLCSPLSKIRALRDR
jgi:hypothetical protein